MMWNFTDLWNQPNQNIGPPLLQDIDGQIPQVFCGKCGTGSDCANSTNFCFVKNGDDALNGTCQNCSLYLEDPKKGNCYCDDADRGKPTGLCNRTSGRCSCTRTGSVSGDPHFTDANGEGHSILNLDKMMMMGCMLFYMIVKMEFM